MVGEAPSPPTVPHLVWALILVFAVGLGPFPWMLALGIRAGGVLGRLFGEVMENVEVRPIEALQATGASRPQILFYGVLPQVLPECVGLQHTATTLLIGRS